MGVAVRARHRLLRWRTTKRAAEGTARPKPRRQERLPWKRRRTAEAERIIIAPSRTALRMCQVLLSGLWMDLNSSLATPSCGC